MSRMSHAAAQAWAGLRRWRAVPGVTSYRRLATLCGLLVLAVMSCRSAELSSDVPVTQGIAPYVGAWQYRYGESPVLPDGSQAWSRDAAPSAAWQNTQRLHNPPGRSGRADLWLRTWLSGPAAVDPTLFLHEVDQCLEAFLDGERIARFGPMQGDAQRFIAKRPIYLPLGSLPTGKLLTLHLRSVYSDIGLIRPPLWGGRAELFADAIHKGLPFLIVGLIAWVLGAGVLGLFLLQRRERLYLLYAVQCLSIGAYLLSRSQARAYLFDHPALWRLILVASFCLISASMCAFIAQLFDDGWSRFMRGMGVANALLFFLGMLGTLTGVIHLELFLKASLLFWLPFSVAIYGAAIHGLLRGNADARILALGLLGTSLLAVPQVLVALHILRMEFDVRALTGIVFIGAMGTILVRRYRAFLQRLGDYSAVLGTSLSSTQHSGSQEHADSTLQALQRLLQAERAVLFLCDESTGGLRVLAARTAQGRLKDAAAATAGCDPVTLDAVEKKRRPAMRQRLRRNQETPSSLAQTQSVMAAPLLVQGRLLGVVYLEASASRREFQNEDLEILIELGNHVALTLTAQRADDLEEQSTHTKRKLDEQRSLLAAAARLAKGELQTPVPIDQGHEHAPLARAIEDMRRDLLAKLRALQESHAAEQQLNSDLRHQLGRRLLQVSQHGGLSDVALDESQRSDGTAGSRDAPTLPPGAPLGRNYRVVTQLEVHGGYQLYQVQRSSDQKRFVAKVVSNAAHPALLARFAREAKLLTVLRDPYLDSIVDIDQAPDGTAFLICERRPSRTLRHLLSLPRTLDAALCILAQLAAGLRVLHQHGIVHRNLQPQSVHVSLDDAPYRVQLVDLGLAAVTAGGHPELADLTSTAAQAAIHADDVLAESTDEARQIRRYRAPELAAGLHAATPQSDVFGFGLLALELLASERSQAEIPASETAPPTPQDSAARLSTIPGLDAMLVSRLAACLHREPAQRPSSEVLYSALASYLPTPPSAPQRAG